MRSPYELLEGYERRSLAHAVSLPGRQFASGLWRGVGYRVGTRRLVSAFDEVAEIVALPPLVPVPRAQPWLLGVGNLRGTLLPVVDLKLFLQGERSIPREGQRVLVVRQGGGDVALVIDEVFGQRSFEQASAAAPVAVAEGRFGHFIDRAYPVDGEEWGVFSLSLLSRTPEFRQAAA